VKWEDKSLVKGCSVTAVGQAREGTNEGSVL
jgi:hypothetical protein